MYASQIEFKDHFSDRASAYASHRPVYSAELIDTLARLAPATTLAWDCGCGSGQMAVPLAESFERVIATDASAEQIAHATAHPRIEYRAAPAEQSGLTENTVDLAVAAQAAHWFDLPAFYREVRRVVRPGGIIALVTCDGLEVNERVDPLIRDFYASLQWPPERRMVEEGYASLPFPFREIEPPRLVIQAEWNVDQLLGYIHTWSAVRELDISAFERNLRDVWRQDAESRTVRWQITMRIGRVE